jgi:hypothetical protein
VALRPVAVKRLALVEVEPRASHQHEFNATILRRGLEIQETRVSGPLTIAFYATDSEEPVVEETTYTLYDSRELQPLRSSEFRLYYASSLVPRLARPGDLLVILRGAGHALEAVIARAGTNTERDLQRALLSGETTALKRFLVVTPPPASYEAGAELALALFPAPPAAVAPKQLSALIAESPALRAALAAGSMPPTKEMAAAAHKLVDALHGTLGPDEFLDRALAAETALYNEIETQLADRTLRAMVGKGELTFPNVMSFTMKYFQSRKARRGASLQNHFARLLEREGIPHTAQCVTEGKERPDFVFPGCREYRDVSFPTGRLRMVACKSRTRERWDEVLNEAARIELKYLLSIDEDITDSAIDKMAQSHIRLFLPKRVLDDHYGPSAQRNALASVRELLVELKAAAET